MNRGSLRRAVRAILKAGLDAVDPGVLVRAHLRARGPSIRAGRATIRNPGRVFVVAAGKAAVPMARAARQILGRRIDRLIVVSHERARAVPNAETFVAGHPIPDAAGARAARCVIRLLRDTVDRDVILLLLSGGASALLPAPIAGVSLREKQRITRLLLRQGASIDELNAVRQCLSRLKGGGFARLAPRARIVTLAISDVPGDDIRTIGSGLTAHDPRAARLARRAIARLIPDAKLGSAIRSALRGTRKPRVGACVSNEVIGSSGTFVRAASGRAKSLGFRVVMLPGGLRGEARLCGPRLMRTFARRRDSRGSRPLCLIATGETVVRVRGKGIGGRNQEVALSAVPLLARQSSPTILAALATDGKDGPTRSAGGLVDDSTGLRATMGSLDVRALLDRNDADRALRHLKAVLKPWKQRTNVADVTVVLG